MEIKRKSTNKGIEIEKILIDSDILTYKCGFSVEGREYHLKFDGNKEATFSSQYIKEVRDFISFMGLKREDENSLYTIEKEVKPEPLENALHNVREMIKSIQEGVGCTSYQLYLTGGSNFRDEISTIQKYKGNRNKLHKPYWYEGIRDYMTSSLGAIIIDGQEADDVMSIELTNNINYCIATIDKDLDNTPGWHYNFDKDALYKVEEKEATYNFYKQLLIGDRVDNIRGIPGVGIKTAEKILSGLSTEREYAQEVYEKYIDFILSGDISDEDSEEYIGTLAWEEMRETGQLLWMRRKEDELWEMPETIERLGS